MARTQIRGGNIEDETIESADLASGSIKAGELNSEAVSSQTTITSVDTSNDYLLIFDATDTALKKVAPTNLGVGTASPGGSDTQVQFNDGSSFGGDSGLTFNKTSGLLTVAKGAVFNEGSHDSDFRVESNDDANILFVNAGTNRIGIGTNTPTALLHISSSETGALFRIDHPDAGIDNPIFFVTGSALNARVGIGTETPDATFAISDDGKVLEVGSADEGSWFEINNGTIYLNSGGGIAISGGDNLGQRFNIAPINGTYGALGIGKYPGATVNIVEVNSENSDQGGDFFVIDSDGQVGIGTTSPGVTLDVTGDVNFDGGAVFNESSADKDFRVESNGNENMLFVDAGNNRVGIGTAAPLTTMHISASAATEAVLTIQGQADAGIRLAADKANGDEGNNPYIDWYQDGQNPTSRNNRLATIAMEGDAGTLYTGSLANALFIDTFCPNAQNSSLRPFQIATDSSKNSHSARITIEGVRGNVGLHTATPAESLHLSGAIRIDSQGRENLLVVTGTLGDDSHQMLVMSTTADGYGDDTNFYVSGSVGSRGTSVKGTSVFGGDTVVSGNLHAAEYIYHLGDTDTYIEFGEDEIQLAAGGRTFIKLDEGSTDKLIINHGALDIDLKVGGENQANLIRTDAANDRVGIATSSPSTLLDVSGSAKANTFVTTPYLTDLGSGTATHLTSSNGVHFLDADSVTLATGKSYHELYLATGSTNGQHIQLAITSSANNPVKLMGDSGGDKAQGTVSFSGAPLNGQTVSFPNVGGGTAYVVTWDELQALGNYTIPNATNINAGIDGAVSGNDMGFVLYGALDLGIAVSSWPFTLVGTYGGEDSVTLSQTSAGTSGNQTITENSDNTTVTGFSGGTELVVGTINSTYGVALAGTADDGALLQGAHLIYDSNSEKWQIIAGTQLTS